MKENKIIRIDLNVWQTPTSKAKEKGYSTQYISNLIRQGKLKSWKIEELGLVLVARDKQAAKEVGLIAEAAPIVQDSNESMLKLQTMVSKVKPVNTDYLNTRRKSKLGLK